MSELQPAPNESQDFTSSVQVPGEDATQPTAEILSVLEQLNNEPQHFTAQEPPKTQDEPPQSEWDMLRAQLSDKPHDPEGWRRLVDIAESTGDLEKIKTTYEALLEAYPNTSSTQIAYLNHFLIPGSFSFAEDLFKRFLKTSSSVELWKFYLTYVRRANPGPTTRDSVRMAYEFALSRVGQDKDSGEIWSDYIQFLRAGEVGILIHFLSLIKHPAGRLLQPGKNSRRWTH
jgi:cleavage stimulation factor subunit 3